MRDRLVYILRLTPVPGDDRPPVIRLKLLLKVVLRALGFRCVTVEEEKQIGKPQDDPVKPAP